MAWAESSNTPSGYSAGNAVQLVKGGKPYFDLLTQLIDEANREIHFQTYIFLGDATGRQVADALRRAAIRGVKVYLLLDAYGSDHLTAHWHEALELAGAKVQWFAPVFWSRHFYFSRRLHHKVFVADGWHSLVGGINICDRYNDTPEAPAWHDWAVHCTGQAALELANACRTVWNKTSRVKEQWKSLGIDPPEKQLPGPCLVRVRRNDWVNRQLQIAKSYLEMFEEAREEIIIMSSYFLPGPAIRNAMLKAQKRGVRIRVIAAGKSDVWTAKQAERYLYRWLLRHGVEVHEYAAHILHGKFSAYDNKWVTIGSYNVNDISTFVCLELNLDIKDEAFAAVAQRTLQRLIASQCTPILLSDLQQYNRWQRMLQQVCFYFVRSVYLLFTFYFRQEKAENLPT